MALPEKNVASTALSWREYLENTDTASDSTSEPASEDISSEDTEDREFVVSDGASTAYSASVSEPFALDLPDVTAGSTQVPQVRN